MLFGTPNWIREKVDLSPLLLACELENANAVQTILQATLPNPNIDLRSQRLLHVNRESSEGDFPLLVAAKRGNLRIVQCLVADERVNASKANQFGYTALDAARDYGHDHVVAFLEAHENKLKGRKEGFASAAPTSARRRQHHDKVASTPQPNRRRRGESTALSVSSPPSTEARTIPIDPNGLSSGARPDRKVVDGGGPGQNRDLGAGAPDGALSAESVDARLPYVGVEEAVRKEPAHTEPYVIRQGGVAGSDPRGMQPSEEVEVSPLPTPVLLTPTSVGQCATKEQLVAFSIPALKAWCSERGDVPKGASKWKKADWIDHIYATKGE